MSISKIVFLKNNTILNEQVSNLVNRTLVNKEHFNRAINKLRYIQNEYFTDIKRVYLINKNSPLSQPKALFFQINGIFAINEEAYKIECVEIKNQLQKFIFKNML